MAFSARVRMFKNFANGNACGHVALTDGAVKSMILDAGHPSETVANFSAPLTVSKLLTCQSSRIALPENEIEDYQLVIPEIVLGDPV